MSAGFIVRLRPAGPWRIGPDSGARDRVGRIFHSDALYSAVTSAMDRMGLLDAWIPAIFENPEIPAVRFSSCFPFQGERLLVAPPRGMWPPSAPAKVRWKGARFVPISVVEELLSGKTPDEGRWMVDGASECLVPADGAVGPFREVLRSNAAVDRLSGRAEPHATACLEFSNGAGLWALAVFADETAMGNWGEPVRAAFRYLADSGMGGERSRGWGKAEAPEFEEGVLPDLVTVPRPPEGAAGEEPSGNVPEIAYWMLSLFSPGESDTVDWGRGDYELVTRGGRVESAISWGAPKKLSRLVGEGSVLFAGGAPQGSARNVAPNGFPHPVYRAGYAVAVPIPWRMAG